LNSAIAGGRDWILKSFSCYCGREMFAIANLFYLLNLNDLDPTF